MKLVRSIALALCLSVPFSHTGDDPFLDRALPFAFGLTLGGLYRIHRGETAAGTIIATAGTAAVIVYIANAQKDNNS